MARRTKGPPWETPGTLDWFRCAGAIDSSRNARASHEIPVQEDSVAGRRLVEPVHGACWRRSWLNPPAGWRLSNGVRPAERPRARLRPFGAGGVVEYTSLRKGSMSPPTGKTIGKVRVLSALAWPVPFPWLRWRFPTLRRRRSLSLLEWQGRLPRRAAVVIGGPSTKEPRRQARAETCPSLHGFTFRGGPPARLLPGLSPPHPALLLR